MTYWCPNKMYTENIKLDELIVNIISSQDPFNFETIEDSIRINLSSSDSLPKTAVIKLNFDSVIELQSNRIVFSVYSFIYSISSENAIFELDEESFITVRFSKNALVMIEPYSESFKTLAFETNATFIDDSTYMPEFSVSCFDDSNFLYPRQVRQGVPIISTVPSFIDNSSNAADTQSYENGKGTVSKTIYFRIICNKVMETISPGNTSLMELKIYIPNGLDTVKPAIYRPMTLVSNDSTNNISIYSTNYDFFEQGNFDGIDYVDGYMYCDVQVPLTVQKSIPIEFDFSV